MNLLESLHLYSKLLIFLFLIRWKVLMDQAGLMACLNLGMLDIHSVYGEDAQTLLIVAVNDGAIDAVRFLLNQDVDIQYQDRNGQSALMYAAIAGHHDIVALLLKAGAEINLCNRFGQNALMLASSLGRLQVVQLLLKHCSSQNSSWFYWIFSKVRRWFGQANNLSIHHQDEHGQTAVMLAAKSGHLAVMCLLEEFGARLDENDLYQENLLFIALRSNQQIVVEYLLKRGMPQMPNVDGMTPMMLAVLLDYQDLLWLLLHFSGDVHALDVQGHSALKLAVEKDHFECARMLVHCGADVRSVLGSGSITYRMIHMLLFRCVKDGYWDLCFEHKQHVAPQSPLHLLLELASHLHELDRHFNQQFNQHDFEMTLGQLSDLLQKMQPADYEPIQRHIRMYLLKMGHIDAMRYSVAYEQFLKVLIYPKGRCLDLKLSQFYLFSPKREIIPDDVFRMVALKLPIKSLYNLQIALGVQH